MSGKIACQDWSARVAASLMLCALTTGAADVQSYTIERGRDWVSVDFHKGVKPGSALDFSQMGLTDAPAGKHGWLQKRNGHFVFEDSPDVVRRFCGPNLCFDGFCPLAEDTEEYADRLVRLGYNTVRFHHMEISLSMGDSGWEGKLDWHSFAPEKLDRFDRFVAALIKRGIYMTTDLYVSRVILWGELGETFGKRPGDWISPRHLYKALAMVEEKSWENWCVYARKFLIHRNPYTGRTYAEEPAMPLLCLINENCLSPVWGFLKSHPDFQKVWRQWLATERAKDPKFLPGVTDDLSSPSAPGPGTSAFDLFEAHVEELFFCRASRFLREELGVKALLTSQNNGRRDPPLHAVRERLYDYVDAHHYDSHPMEPYEAENKPGAPKSFKMATRGCDPGTEQWIGGAASSYIRLASLPQVYTESDFAFPAPWRSSYGLLMGAIGGMQGLDGVWRYGWYLDWNNKCRELKDDYQCRPRSFDQLCDPLSLASDRFTTLLYLRGDVPLLRGPGIAVRFTPDTMKRDGSSPVVANALPYGLCWNVKVAGCVEKPAPKGWAELSYAEISELNAKGGPYPVAPDPNRAFVRDVANACIALKTRRSCGGFAHPESGLVKAGDLDFQVKGSYASVLASSVDSEDVPLRSSKRILVMHLTEMQFEGSKVIDCDRGRERYRYLTEVGTNAVIRAGQCAFSLKLDEPKAYRVYALDTMGRRLDEVPAVSREGRLDFMADVHGPDGKARFHYEVVAR